MFHTAFKAASAAIIAFYLIASTSTARPLDPPKGDVVLSISGNIQDNNKGGPSGVAEFDIDMLRELGSESFETSTIWTEGVNTYTGVPLNTLLKRVRAEGTQIEATAINDYKITIPMDTITDTAPIVAYEMDGQPMPRRGKGPLWVIYPYDSSADYRTEVVYSHSIWQLNRISVLNE